VSQFPGGYEHFNPVKSASSGSPTHGATGKEGAAAESLRLIAFTLGNEWYALEASEVRGIEPEATITPVPRSPEWLVGVFNLHGNILPAIDPRPILGVPRVDSQGTGLMIIFLWEGNLAALRVDAVDEIYELPNATLEPPLPTIEGSRMDMILGQVRVRDRLIGVIHLSNLVRHVFEG
jgi:purine-binding chemotaxis protein CheW